MRRLVLVVVAVLGLVGLVEQGHAQPALAPPPAPPARAHDERSPAVAVGLSVGVTVAGAAALFVPSDGARFGGVIAMYLGPSTGRWYAGESSASGIGYRLLGTGLVVAGIALDMDRECDDRAPCSGPGGATIALAVVGAGVWLASAAVDTVRAHQAARRTHDRRAVSVAPTALRSGVTYAPGVAIAGQF